MRIHVPWSMCVTCHVSIIIGFVNSLPLLTLVHLSGAIIESNRIVSQSNLRRCIIEEKETNNKQKICHADGQLVLPLSTQKNTNLIF